MTTIVPLPDPVRATATPSEDVASAAILTPAGDRVWVMDVGLACCAVEVSAAMSGPLQLAQSLGAGPGLGGVNVLVISGTVTDTMALAVRRLHDRLPGPTYVISFGACSNSGGPYWDSYCVTKGVDQIVAVDVYVPGCPPRPEALREGLRELMDVAAARGRRA